MPGTITVPTVRNPLNILRYICSFHCQDILLSNICNVILWPLGGAVLSVLFVSLASNNSNERTCNLKENNSRIKVLFMMWWGVGIKQRSIFLFSVEKLIRNLKLGYIITERNQTYLPVAFFSNPRCSCVNTAKVWACWCWKRSPNVNLVAVFSGDRIVWQIQSQREIHSFMAKLTTIYLVAVCLWLQSYAANQCTLADT